MWHDGEWPLPHANTVKQLANLNHHGALASPCGLLPSLLTLLSFTPSWCSLHLGSTESLPLRPWIPTLTPTTSRHRPPLVATPTPATATLRRREVVLVLAAPAGPRRTVALLPRGVLLMHQLFVVLFAHFLLWYLPGEAGAQSLQRVGSVRTEHSHHGA